jgi:hypothetical protein
LLLCGCLPSDSGQNDVDNEDDKQLIRTDSECTEIPNLFSDTIWPSIKQSCVNCHNSGGVANNARLIFSKNRDKSIENYNVLRNFSRINAETLLSKTIGLPSHGGGAPYVDQSSQEYQNLENLVAVMAQDCDTKLGNDPGEDNVPKIGFFDSIEFLDEQETLRRAAIILAARLPTTQEFNAVAVGGERSLRATIRNMMEGEHFENFVLETANNHFLSTGINFNFPHISDYPKLDEIDRAPFHAALGQEPLQLLRYIVVNERPYTEILTANYTLVNPDLALVYEADVSEAFNDIADSSEWQKATIPNMLRFGKPFPHAGVLTTHAWLHRFPTTATNRNRHRAKIALRQFMGIDLEALAQRPLGSESQFLVPTLEDPACISCHNILDPVAGAFQNWADRNRYRRFKNNTTALSSGYRSKNYPKDANDNAYYQNGDNWFRDMLLPGFNQAALPGGYKGNQAALQWLGQEMVKDSRFAMGSVYFWYHGLFAKPPLATPFDDTATNYSARLNAFNAQNEIFKGIATRFREDQGYGAYNVKDLLADLIISKWFRAKKLIDQATLERDSELEDIGAYQLLTPEKISRKMLATVNVSWQKLAPITSGYGLLYGGFDAKELTERNTSVNTLLSVTLERMGNELVCDIVKNDFSKSGNERLLFPFVEITDTPANAGKNIQLNIQYLYSHMLNEALDFESAELLQTYDLFQAIWNKRNITSKAALNCSLSNKNDPEYGGRSWAIVLLYLMDDPRYIYSY